MEKESEMSSLQWFHIHWSYDKYKIMIDYVKDIHIKYMGYYFILTSVVPDQVFSYIMSFFSKDEIVYNYSSLFSNSYCMNNPLNVKVKFE